MLNIRNTSVYNDMFHEFMATVSKKEISYIIKNALIDQNKLNYYTHCLHCKYTKLGKH